MDLDPDNIVIKQMQKDHIENFRMVIPEKDHIQGAILECRKISNKKNEDTNPCSGLSMYKRMEEQMN